MKTQVEVVEEAIKAERIVILNTEGLFTLDIF